MARPGDGPERGGRPGRGAPGDRRRAERPERTEPGRGAPRGGPPRPGGPGGPPRGGGNPRGGGGRRPRPDTDASVFAARGELLYGRNAVAEALRGRRTPHRLLLAEGNRPDDRLRKIVSDIEERGVPVEEVPRELLDDATRGANHQGVALDAAEYPYADLDDLLGVTGNVLALDHLQDPQNFGSLLRAADAAGVAGVVIPQDRAVGVTPAVVNASAGAVEHLTVALVPNLARALDALKGRGWWVVGLEAGEASHDLYAIEVPLPAALVVGSEGGGIGPNVAKRCDLLVSLPTRGKVASLNAATAGAVALFELLRRERGQDDPSPDGPA